MLESSPPRVGGARAWPAHSEPQPPSAPGPAMGREHRRGWYLATGALTGVPVLVGQLAGPSFSHLSEAAVLSALLVGAALGGGVLALAQGGWVRPLPVGWWGRWPALSLGIAVIAMIQAFGALWLAGAFGTMGLPPGLGMVCGLGIPAAAAGLAVGGHRWVLTVLAAGALACWAVFLGGFPWFHATAYPGAPSVLGSVPRPSNIPAPD